ncbi:MAG TPA: hypothetical protein DF383_06430 [Deltaproteobacteria bacterium]|nr:hypothetical protein [Deltaproteobacteria bacterium]
MFGGSLPFLISGIYGLLKGTATHSQLAVSFGLASLILIGFSLIPFLNVVRRRNSARRFDQAGITRFDGKTLPWREFKFVRRSYIRNKYRHTILERVKLHFSSGTAIVMVNAVKNLEEVLTVIQTIEAGNNPWH